MLFMDELSKLFATPEPPELGPGPRPDVWSADTVNQAVDKFCRVAKLPGGKAQLILALALLWHDHLEASHVLAQSVDTSDGAFVHGIMHRREPDYGNAAYWFRRVGRHSAFPEIARRVAECLTAVKQDYLAARLAPQGEWDAFAFINACEQAGHCERSDRTPRLLREAQKIETEVLAQVILAG